MSSISTNVLKVDLFDAFFRGANPPANFYIALITNASVVDADVNVLGDLVEIPAGNGYTSGGIQLNPDNIDFPTLIEDDANDKGSFGLRDIVWTAAGGSIPGSGDPVRYLVLTDDNATIANRKVYLISDLGADVVAIDGQVLYISGFGAEMTDIAP